jgi:GntP family gluconate:H+ symporter
MSAPPPVLLAAGAIAALLILILRLKIHPFVALLLVSVTVALIGGIAPAEIVRVVEGGMGKTLGHIALIIPLGAMIGRMIERSGGAAALARQLVERFGPARARAALVCAGFVVGIPVFFEVGVIMLMPMAQSVARTAGRPLLQLALPLCVTLLIVHAFLPPHPGPVAAAGLLGSDAGRILMLGIPVCAVTALLAFFFSRFVTRLEASGHAVASVNDHFDEPKDFDDRQPRPGLAITVSLILLPIVLIMLGSVAQAALSQWPTSRAVLTVLGTPFIALLLDVLLCGYLLGVRRGWSRQAVFDVLGSALPSIALVILVTGAGGAFAQVLVSTGVGSALAAALRSTGLPVLGLAFLLTLLLRAAQGPTTVALITTAGIIAPLVSIGHFNANQLALICLAMGAGGMACSHVNDPGFWIVTRLIGLHVGEGLRTWTVMTTFAGVVGLLLTALLWAVVSP